MDWTKHPLYGQPGWTLIHDDQGSRFVEAPKKRKRKLAKLRFADLQPDTILLHQCKSTSVRYEQPERLQPYAGTSRANVVPLSFANDDAKEVVTVRQWVTPAICTDRWFDPCLGQDDPLKGQMAAVQAISNNGRVGSKWPHTLRGLAQQGYSYATPAQAERVRVFLAERGALMEDWLAGRIDQPTARLRATPWRVLMRDLGLDEGPFPVP